MRSMISWWVKNFPSLFIIIDYLYYLLFHYLFALYLDWSLNACVDKKIKKWKIFYSLVLFSRKMYNRSGKKLTGKKLNVDRQLFKDVLCVTLLQVGGGGGPYQILGNIAAHFPDFHSFINTSWEEVKIFIYSNHLFLSELSPCLSNNLLINHIYSWEIKLKHTGVDITCFLKMQSLR